MGTTASRFVAAAAILFSTACGTGVGSEPVDGGESLVTDGGSPDAGPGEVVDSGSVDRDGGMATPDAGQVLDPLPPPVEWEDICEVDYEGFASRTLGDCTAEEFTEERDAAGQAWLDLLDDLPADLLSCQDDSDCVLTEASSYCFGSSDQELRQWRSCPIAVSSENLCGLLAVSESFSSENCNSCLPGGALVSACTGARAVCVTNKCVTEPL